MENKSAFIEMVECLIASSPTIPSKYPEGLEYWNKFVAKEEISDKGKIIISTMREMDKGPLTAKEIAENSGLPSSRSVSGAMRKLVTDGYVERVAGSSPTQYTLTTAGREKSI